MTTIRTRKHDGGPLVVLLHFHANSLLFAHLSTPVGTSEISAETQQTL